MSTKNKTQDRRAPRSWLITALLASLAVAYVAFVFVPGQAEISTLRSQLNERRQHILQASSLVLPVENATAQLAKTRLVSLDWKRAAPSADELSECLGGLTNEAKAAGVVIEQFVPATATEMQVLAQQGVTIHLQGSFPQVFDFIRRIEELPATIWVPSLRLTADERGGSTLRGELNLTIFVDRKDSTDNSGSSGR